MRRILMQRAKHFLPVCETEANAGSISLTLPEQ